MFEHLGLHDTPSILRVYFVLLLIFALLVLVALLPGASPLWPLASDGFETVLTAFLGALSAIAANRES